jgi:hypothetical protein
VKVQPELNVAWVVLAALLLLSGCASSGSSPDPLPVVEAPVPALPSMRELYEAGDYAGTVRAFLADTTLANQDLAVFRAAMASAMPGHSAHQPVRALALFNRLVAEFPDSDYLTEARLLSDLLVEAEELRGQNDRLMKELEQMKAIDLGQQP